MDEAALKALERIGRIASMFASDASPTTVALALCVGVIVLTVFLSKLAPTPPDVYNVHGQDQGAGWNGGVRAAAPDPIATVRPELKPLCEGARRRLGAGRVTMATLGVLLRERSARELKRVGAPSLVPHAADLVEAIALATRDLYLVTVVPDDATQEAVAQCLGGLPGVPRHRLLFCDKDGSKVSIARQIEPDLVSPHPPSPFLTLPLTPSVKCCGLASLAKPSQALH